MTKKYARRGTKKFTEALHARDTYGKFVAIGGRTKKREYTVTKTGQVRRASPQRRRQDRKRLARIGVASAVSVRHEAISSFTHRPGLHTLVSAGRTAAKAARIANEVNHYKKVHGKKRLTDPNQRRRHDLLYRAGARGINVADASLTLSRSQKLPPRTRYAPPSHSYPAIHSRKFSSIEEQLRNL